MLMGNQLYCEFAPVTVMLCPCRIGGQGAIAIAVGLQLEIEDGILVIDHGLRPGVAGTSSPRAKPNPSHSLVTGRQVAVQILDFYPQPAIDQRPFFDGSGEAGAMDRGRSDEVGGSQPLPPVQSVLASPK